jgi:hypothetical protein
MVDFKRSMPHGGRAAFGLWSPVSNKYSNYCSQYRFRTVRTEVAGSAAQRWASDQARGASVTGCGPWPTTGSGSDVLLNDRRNHFPEQRVDSLSQSSQLAVGGVGNAGADRGPLTFPSSVKASQGGRATVWPSRCSSNQKAERWKHHCRERPLTDLSESKH